MSDSRRNPIKWRKITRAVMEHSPTAAILHALIEQYRASKPGYIPSYEVEMIFDGLGLSKELYWKSFIDLSCYDLEIFDLKFQFLFDDDDFDISFDDLQMILAGESIRVGANVYTASLAKKHIFPYLVPTKGFYWLLDHYSNTDFGQPK